MKMRTMFRACNAAATGYKPGVGSRKPGRSHTGPLWICSCCGAPIRVRHCGLSGRAQLRRGALAYALAWPKLLRGGPSYERP